MRKLFLGLGLASSAMAMNNGQNNIKIETTSTVTAEDVFCHRSEFQEFITKYGDLPETFNNRFFLVQKDLENDLFDLRSEVSEFRQSVEDVKKISERDMDIMNKIYKAQYFYDENSDKIKEGLAEYSQFVKLIHEMKESDSLKAIKSSNVSSLKSGITSSIKK